MRIRKHARLLSALSAPSDAPIDTKNTHTDVAHGVCELNMSPWDVISPDEFPNQVEFNEAVVGNRRTVGGSTTTVASLLKYWEEVRAKKDEAREDDEVDGEEDDIMEEDGDYREENKNKNKNNKKKQKKKRIESIDVEANRDELVVAKRRYICCNKADGKGWRCRREAKNGHSLCEHHLTQLKSYHSNNNISSHCSSISKSNTTRKVNVMRNCRAKASLSSSEFYYYSGFGPSWGKNRSNELSNGSGDCSKIMTNNNDHDVHDQELSSSSNNSTHDNDDTTTSLSDFVVDNDDLDYEDDYDDDDGHGAGGGDGKKKFRKPIKARSLKSLL